MILKKTIVMMIVQARTAGTVLAAVSGLAVRYIGHGQMILDRGSEFGPGCGMIH